MTSFVAVSMVIAYRLRSATPISSASIEIQSKTAFEQRFVDIDRRRFDTFELQRRTINSLISFSRPSGGELLIVEPFNPAGDVARR